MQLHSDRFHLALLIQFNLFFYFSHFSFKNLGTLCNNYYFATTQLNKTRRTIPQPTFATTQLNQLNEICHNCHFATTQLNQTRCILPHQLLPQPKSTKLASQLDTVYLVTLCHNHHMPQPKSTKLVKPTSNICCHCPSQNNFSTLYKCMSTLSSKATCTSTHG